MPAVLRAPCQRDGREVKSSGSQRVFWNQGSTSMYGMFSGAQSRTGAISRLSGDCKWFVQGP